MKLYYNCEIEKLIRAFYLRKDSQRYTNECKQGLNDKRRRWRSSKNERCKSYNRYCFQQEKKKLLKKEHSDVTQIQIVDQSTT